MELKKITDRLDQFISITSQSPCIIIYQGKQLTMPSGKSSWKTKGYAKSALSNAFGYDNYEFKKEHGENLTTYLEREGIVEFKTFDINNKDAEQTS